MKKQLIIAAVLCVLLTGCTGTAKETVQNDSGAGAPVTSSQGAVTSGSAVTEAPVIDSTRKDRAFLTFENSEMRISAELVLFDSENKDALEKVQIDALKKYISSQTGSELALERQPKDIVRLGDFSNLSIDLDADLTLSDSDTISIVYTGELTDKAAAHPTHLVFSLNLDARTLEQISFSEKYKVGEEMYGLYASASAAAMTEKWGEKYEEEVGSFSDVICKAEDFSGKIADGSIVAYYTENDIVLSFPLEYVLGGHIEVAVPHVQLDAIKTDLTPLKVLVESGDYSITYESYTETPDEADYYLSARGNDKMMTSMYLGTFKTKEVSDGKILTTDIDGDKKKEIIINMEISGNGATLTSIYKIKDDMLEHCTEIDTLGIELLCEYKNGKKARIYSEKPKFSQEIDISKVFSAEFFDKNGKATGNGSVSIKEIHGISVTEGKLVCTAGLCLDDGVAQFNINFTISVSDGKYSLTPSKILPIE